MSDYTLETQGNKRFYQNSGIERLTELLHENGIDEKRFIKLRGGTKQSYTDHTKPYNQYRPHDVEGNYGVLAGFGLLVLDSDHYKDGEEIPDELYDLLHEYPTYWVETPHKGNHFYYIVPEDLPERIQEVCGKPNPKLGAVEVKSKNSLVVGPGSELDGCTKDWCDNCIQEGEGRYQIDTDHDLNTLDFDRFIEVVDELTEDEPDTSQYESSPGEITLQTDAVEWIENAREWDPKLNQLMECLGDAIYSPEEYPKVEYTDRSSNEVALANKILRRIGSFEDFERHTYRIMDQLNPPKWSKRGEDYRKSVIESAKAKSTDIGEYYKMKQSNNSSNGSSRVIQHKVTEVILTIRIDMPNTFKTSEVAQWQDFSYDQTIRVLNDLAEAGYLQKKGKTKGVRWVKQSEIPAFGPEYELIIQQYTDVEEDKQQRHEFLSQND